MCFPSSFSPPFPSLPPFLPPFLPSSLPSSLPLSLPLSLPFSLPPSLPPSLSPSLPYFLVFRGVIKPSVLVLKKFCISRPSLASTVTVVNSSRVNIKILPFLYSQTMSVDDFATTLAYLMRVCWSAAAGQLHLASIGDSEPSSPAQSFRAKPTPSSTPPTQLQAGICAQQERGSVSAKVHVLCTLRMYGSVVLVNYKLKTKL